jgi:hypothetical protein
LKTVAVEVGHKTVLLRYILTVLGTLITLVSLCALVGLFPIEFPSRKSIASLIFVFLGDVRPEPMERRMFLASVASLPFIVTAWHLFWKNVTDRMTPVYISRVFLWVSGSAIVAFLFYLFQIRAEAAFFVRMIAAGAGWYVYCTLTAGGICFLLYRDEKRSLFWVNILLGICAAILLLSVFLYCLYDNTTVSDDYMYSIHFNVIFHSMVQVFLGKELLVDFVHQYGLYPHFLEPLFRITGLSLVSFTATMGGLTVLTFLLILRTLLLLKVNRTIALLGFLALVSGGYIAKIMSSHDPYFQYFPLRTIFPVIAAWALVRYLTIRSTARFLTLYVVASSAILWNPETGIVVMIAVLLTTLYDEFSRHDLRNGVLVLCKAACVSAVVIAVFSGYLYLRYGVFPDYRELIRYMQIFYGIGFYMLPMLPLHPWNLVAIVYIAGLVWGSGALINGTVTHRTSVVTFLSLLGIGLFSYYQGRSHNEVLLLCIYPAFMLLTIFADSLLALETGFTTARMAALGCVIFLVFVAGGLYRGLQTLYFGEVGIVRRYESHRKGIPSEVMNRAGFIKDRTRRGEEVLILSGHSGLFHLVSQTTNPIHIPSVQETVLVEDYQRILSYVDQGPCRKLFIDVWDMAYNNPSYGKLREILAARYVSDGMTADLGLAMFVRVR